MSHEAVSFLCVIQLNAYLQLFFFFYCHCIGLPLPYLIYYYFITYFVSIDSLWVLLHLCIFASPEHPNCLRSFEQISSWGIAEEWHLWLFIKSLCINHLEAAHGFRNCISHLLFRNACQIFTACKTKYIRKGKNLLSLPFSTAFKNS